MPQRPELDAGIGAAVPVQQVRRPLLDIAGVRLKIWFAVDALPTPLSMITYANCTECAASPAETGEAGKIESVFGQLRAVSGPTGRLAS